MISNELDIEPFRARLRAHGRVQVPGFLQEDAATRLHDCLRDEVRWETAQRTDARQASGQARSALPERAEDAALPGAATRRARDGFGSYPPECRVVDTFTPLWNSLSLVRVPRLHAVSLVVPWAGSPGYSITGWFRRG